MEKFYVKSWKVTLLQVPHIKQLHKDKVNQTLALTILKFICEEIHKLKSNHTEQFYDAYLAAMLNDTPEVIELIARICPQLVWARDSHAVAEREIFSYGVFSLWIPRFIVTRSRTFLARDSHAVAEPEITAAFIFAIVLVAALTVPGGNNKDTGKAVDETVLSFIIFAVSDVMSMIISGASLLLFRSFDTARYADEDFLYNLPKSLILGLVMLFMSVATMLIAFSATLYIMFVLESTWILIPVAAIACLPITLFVKLQLPLLVELISSTYACGIFGKRRELAATS
ncbi:putative PGG domain-containing protein [Helianthus annuus]|uniref:PGG domain-containing protein n=2 Tax=Helianthus annuus TaxID=4232 RepID=A0A9K3NTC0_HELAN|nr:putative PGG domain-containing protein [Helianthus annuus]KAJ0589968.1 putative PGG domain-containing protein [Helianthus annuus]KAJ0758486.1 putative PGG domain-containing protein [Helianthus annuus]KAJ0762147.1 putative PGG domain-containing protein [Helianthus annuus]KAJ0927906.1 putative PGG domain-containing protein [Helianthus annuus]